MARPREFDEDVVLDAAMLAFWRAGYEGCSIGDLVDATGLKRQSLYNVYTDKHGLFARVLEHYQRRIREELAGLDRADAGLADLRCYIEAVLDLHRSHDVGACLIVKTAFAPQMHDPVLAAAVHAGAKLVRLRFRSVLVRAQARGELGDDIDPGTAAAYLFTVLNGLSALVRTAKRPKLVPVLDVTFASLQG